MTGAETSIEREARELAELRAFCAEIYLVLGHLDAPVGVLDQAAAAANGWELPFATLLPYPEALADVKGTD